MKIHLHRQHYQNLGVEKPTKNHQCPDVECNYSFYSANELKSHYQNKHTNKKIPTQQNVIEDTSKDVYDTVIFNDVEYHNVEYLDENWDESQQIMVDDHNLDHNYVINQMNESEEMMCTEQTIQSVPIDQHHLDHHSSANSSDSLLNFADSQMETNAWADTCAYPSEVTSSLDSHRQHPKELQSANASNDCNVTNSMSSCYQTNLGIYSDDESEVTSSTDDVIDCGRKFNQNRKEEQGELNLNTLQKVI